MPAASGCHPPPHCPTPPAKLEAGLEFWESAEQGPRWEGQALPHIEAIGGNARAAGGGKAGGGCWGSVWVQMVAFYINLPQNLINIPINIPINILINILERLSELYKHTPLRDFKVPLRRLP